MSPKLSFLMLILILLFYYLWQTLSIYFYHEKVKFWDTKNYKGFPVSSETYRAEKNVIPKLTKKKSQTVNLAFLELICILMLESRNRLRDT